MSDPGAIPKAASVQVLYFAGARDVVGVREETVAIAPEGCTVEALAAQLFTLHPALAPHARSLRLAVNGEYARASDPVRRGDEVAVIPPVAGG